MQKSWILHTKAGEKLPQVEFKEEIAEVYLKSYSVLPKGARPSSSQSALFGNARVLDNVRFDRKEHYLVETKIINAEDALVKIARRRLSAKAASAILVFAYIATFPFTQNKLDISANTSIGVIFF